MSEDTLINLLSLYLFVIMVAGMLFCRRLDSKAKTDFLDQ